MEYSYNGILLKKLADKKWVKAINKFLESNLFIAILAALVLICNIFGLEFFIYTIVISYGIYLCLLGRDMRSLAAAVPFMYLSPSMQNNPAANPNSIFSFANGLWFIIVYLVAFLIVLTIRIIVNFKEGLFKGARWKLLTGFAVLSLAFLLGGIGQSEYDFRNLIYSVLLIVSISLLYIALMVLVDWKTVHKDYFAWIGMIMGFIVALEVASLYVQGGVIGEDGQINMGKIVNGWGVNTNMAGVLMCAIPCAFYFVATKEKFWPYILAATFIYIAAIVTGSRNGILVGGLVFVASAIFAILPKKDRRKKIKFYIGVVIVLLAICLICFKAVFIIFNHLITNGFVDFARLDIYKSGLMQFADAVIFGKGFFACDAFAWGTEELMIIPPRWHCTIIQMLASCGLVGFAAYAFHRYQTVKLFLKNPTQEKAFIALSIGALLLSSLVDCFFFNIGPGLFYSVMLVFLEKADDLQPTNEQVLTKENKA